jgi:hypothetical protein
MADLLGSPSGPTGSDQIQARGSLDGDPREAVPLYAAGTMDSISPQHLIGRRGSVYKYGNTIVGGSGNLLHNGAVAYSCYNPADTGTIRSITLGLNTDDITQSYTNGAYTSVLGVPFTTSSSYAVDNFGEMVIQATVGPLGGGSVYGAIREIFTIAGTVSQVTVGSGIIDFAGTTLTTASLTAAYGYTPSKTNVKPGDVLAVVQGAKTYFHRILSIDSNTRLQVRPVWAGTSAGPGAGLGFNISRTGFGSYSRVIPIFNSTNGKQYLYYAGNSQDTQTFGTVECVVLPDNTHFMCPQSAGQDVQADDIVYYKGYLLYGAGTAVRWTRAGFPNTFPFDAADFPATNVTVVDNSDRFISFEFIGDQLIAFYQNSIWLVYPTGSIPEFNFYRVPEIVGANQTLNMGPMGSTIFYRNRPTCSTRASAYYLSKAGLMMTQGGPATPVADDISTFWDLSMSNGISAENSKGGIVWGTGGKNLYLNPVTQSWSVLDVTFRPGTMSAFTGSLISSNGLLGQVPRRFGPAFWDSNTQSIIFMDATTNGPENPNASAQTGMWYWSSRVLNLGDVYEGFKFGGFRIETMSGQVTQSIDWQLYGGSSPWNMSLRSSGTAQPPTINARALLGKASDDAFIAVKLIGNNWSGVVGALVYNANYRARR